MTDALANSSSSGVLDSLGLSQQPVRSTKKDLDQADFMKLMTAQLQAQDPLKPMDSSAFLGQIAQFSQVSGLQTLNTSFSALANNLTGNQTLQGANLIGRSVSVAGSSLTLGATGSASASTTLPQSGDVRLQVRDSSGALVRTMDYGSQAKGNFTLGWDGATSSGIRAADGTYSITAQLVGSDGLPQALATQVSQPVTAISTTSAGLQLTLQDGSRVALSEVTAIR